MKYVLEIKADHPQDLGGDAKAGIVARLEQVLDEEGFDNIDTVLNGQGGTTTIGRIWNLMWGWIGVGNNEFQVYHTHRVHKDAAGVRIGSNTDEPVLGFLCFDHVRDDERGEQLALIIGKRDERFRHLGAANLTGASERFIRRHDPNQRDDAQMVKVATEEHDRIIFHVPIHLEAGAYINGIRIV